MQINRIHPYIESGDMERSRDFYAGAFGLEVAMSDPVLNLRSPHTSAAQLIVVPAGMEAPQPDFGIDVGEPGAVDAAHRRVLALGGRVVYPLTDEPWGVRRFFASDLDGRIFNVLAHNTPA